MERGGSKFLLHLKQIYVKRFGWSVTVSRSARGLRVTMLVGRLLSPPSLSAVMQLQEKLEKCVRPLSSGFEVVDERILRRWWIVDDPVGTIQMLASFVNVPCSSAEARLLWLGL